VVVDRRAVGFGEFRGRDALHSYYQGIFDNADELHEELEVVADDGDVVVASCRLTATLAGQPDAGPVSFDYALRIRLSEGLIVEMDIYEDAEAAGAAA
jgi:ketosteroid isomerase-like protein